MSVLHPLSCERDSPPTLFPNSLACRTIAVGPLAQSAIREPNLSVDLNDLRDRLCVWRGWLDWEVRMARPQLQANVSTWNVGPLGYEASKEQLRRALCEGRAVLMVQELCLGISNYVDRIDSKNRNR